MSIKFYMSCLVLAAVAGAARAQSGSQSTDARKQDKSEVEKRLERLEQQNAQTQEEKAQMRAEIEALRAALGKQQTKPGGGKGSAGTQPLESRSGDYEAFQTQSPSMDQTGGRSFLNEKVTFGGLIDFEFFDSQAERRNLGTPFGNQFGLTNGATEMRIRRLRLDIGIEMIEDLTFTGTLMLDPVVRDQDEGSVDINQAYVKFSNLGRNLLNFEDPTRTYIKAGNYYPWERDFGKFHSEAYSLAGTAFYRYGVTGIELGGDMESGVFYRVSVENGYMLSSRSAGDGNNASSGSFGGSPVIVDREKLGDTNNRKDIVFGLGIKSTAEEPAMGYRLGLSYRYGKLSNTERTNLATVIGPTYDGGDRMTRFGILGGLDWQFDTFDAGIDAEYWRGEDGNAKRDILSAGPWIKLKLEGTQYQQRPFFTGVGFGYRISNNHQHDGIPNPNTVNNIILADRTMHTGVMWLDVTTNVDLLFEVNAFETKPSVSDTEWLVRWRVKF